MQKTKIATYRTLHIDGDMISNVDAGLSSEMYERRDQNNFGS
jgi:hypothetical protein